jgi:hypothetical protein
VLPDDVDPQEVPLLKVVVLKILPAFYYQIGFYRILF